MEINLGSKEIEAGRTVSENIEVNAGELVINKNIKIEGFLDLNCGAIKAMDSIEFQAVNINAGTFDGGLYNTYNRISLQAGSFSTGKGSKINGDISIQVGDIELDNTLVEGSINSQKGFIKLLNSSTVLGHIKVTKPFLSLPFFRRRLKVIISNSILKGDLICDHPVKLVMVGDSKVEGAIIGPWIRE